MISAALQAIVDQYGLRRSGRRFVGPCPFCAGSRKSDKFQLWEDGGYKCYGCGESGDRVKWLRKMENMSCPEAHLAADKECHATSCPVYDTCRLGNGNKVERRHQPSRGRTATVPTAKQPQPVATVTDPEHPSDTWQQWAAAMVDKAAGNLQSQTDVLTWLAARGIDKEAATRFRLGWLNHDSRVSWQSVGIDPASQERDRLWIPGGLLIPITNQDGTIHRLRVRRTDEAKAKFLQDLRYVWIKGSGKLPLTIAPTGELRGAVIVEAELDAMAIAAAHPDVAVIAVGTVAGGVSEAMKKRLHELPVILVALDADPDDPGPANGAKWAAEFRQASFYPVPSEKDPGDYAKAGGDLHAWIESGLVPRLQRPTVHEPALSPESPSVGGQGMEEKNTENDIPEMDGLKWCPICWGDVFFAADAGGRFCVKCFAESIEGKAGTLVRATVSREDYLHV